MDISDFQGIHKYKFILPTVYIFSWISMFAGPILYPVFYEYINHFFLLYGLTKVVTTLISIVNAIILHQGVLQRVNSTAVQVDQEKSFLNPTHQLIYGYVIPNYKEEEQMLAETLQVLAAHQRAKQKYCIFLAMEAHEIDSDKKAQRLVQRYKSKFRFINFSVHQLRQYEQKGKASNVSWCVQHLQPILKKNNIPQENLFLTIIDADSWVPPIYIDLLEEEIHKNYDNRHINIYQPPQIYTRNNLQVPMFVRIYDIMHGYYHLGALTSFLDLAPPLSNYTLSYQLVKRIGFWDTCADAIGEDFHTFQKAFWKTNGEVRAKIILAPFNQSNIQTGKGYCQNIKARFWQGQRHSQGCADIAYSMKQLTKNPKMLKGYAMMYFVLETFIVPAIVPWIFLSHLFQTYILSNFIELHPQQFTWGIDDFMILMAVLSYISYFLYEYYKRSSNQYIYKQENQSLCRMMEHVIFNFVNMFMFTVPNFVIAAFRVLKKDRVYTVADKKATRK